MSDGLPKTIDARRLADTGRHLQGEISLDSLPRLYQLVHAQENCLFPLSLEFSRQQGGRRIIRGHISGRVFMDCQRCLEPVEIKLDCDISLGIVADEEEAELLPDELDPLIAGEESQLYELLEDELLLALPIVPTHEQCDSPLLVDTGQQAKLELPERENPFAVLAGLKKEK